MPIKKSLGFEATLVKSFTVKDAPKPNMISANATGAIEVTMPILFYPLNVYTNEIGKKKEVYEIYKRFKTFLKNLALLLKTCL